MIMIGYLISLVIMLHIVVLIWGLLAWQRNERLFKFRQKIKDRSIRDYLLLPSYDKMFNNLLIWDFNNEL